MDLLLLKKTLTPLNSILTFINKQRFRTGILLSIA